MGGIQGRAAAETCPPGHLGFKEKPEVRAPWIRKAFLKQNIIFAGTQWIPGSVGRQRARSLIYPQDKRTGLQPPPPSAWAESGSAITSYSEKKIILILFFNVSSKTKVFESSHSCPWCFLHEAKELKLALKRV